jgi:acetyltransferase-like isoleucine patch superfamily enzyme
MKNLIRLLYHKIKQPTCFISSTARISLDSNLDKNVSILEHSRIGSCKIGKGTYVGSKSTIERTEIGVFTSIGPQVLCGLGTHPLDFISTYPGFYSKNASGSKWLGTSHKTTELKSVKIGSDVWIGARAIIIGGVNIGHGSVIGSGAVVTKDVPPFAIVGGVPAKLIRYRFDSELISLILKSKWWDNSFETLTQVSKYSHDPKRFIAEINSISNEN